MNSKPRIVYLNAAGSETPALSDEQMQSAFSMEATHPLWRSLMQVLNEEMVGAVSDVSARDLSDSDRAHASGRIEAVNDLIERFDGLRRGTRRTERPEK